jgi:hypothetical protein
VDRDGVPGVIDEELLSRLVVLAKGDVEGPEPRPVSETELAVLIAVGVILPVFLPQTLKGHMLSRELGADIIEGMHIPPLRREGDAGGKKKIL